MQSNCTLTNLTHSADMFGGVGFVTSNKRLYFSDDHDAAPTITLRQ